VLATVVPQREVYAQSFGLPVPDTGRDVWRRVARELIGPVRILLALSMAYRHLPVGRACHARV